MTKYPCPNCGVDRGDPEKSCEMCGWYPKSKARNGTNFEAQDVCEVCGKKLTKWNQAWGTGKCSRCAKGRSVEAKELMEQKLKNLSNSELNQVANAQKLLIVALFLSFIGVFLLGAISTSSPLQWLYCFFVTFQIIALYRLANSLQCSSAIMWAIWGLFPLAKIVVMLILSHKATKVLRSASIPVGIFGAKTKPSIGKQEHELADQAGRIRKGSIVAAIIWFIIFGLAFFGIPQFIKIFQDVAVPLPMLTELIISIPRLLWAMSCLASLLVILKDIVVTNSKYIIRINWVCNILALTILILLVIALFIPLIILIQQMG